MEFSQDGQWVVYVTDPYESLWRSRRDGSERVQLTSSDDVSAGIARWSPDGSRIVFEASHSGSITTKLALISRDGGKVEQLIPDKEDRRTQSDPTWSPDGNEIIFARDAGEAAVEPMKLLRVDVRTRKVTPFPGSEGLFSPRWSPDGHYLAALTTDGHSIRRFDFEKQKWATWFTPREGGVAWSTWSPDSRDLFFLHAEGKDAPQSWWRIALNERTPTRVMELPEERAFGAWYSLGPDGSAYFTRDLNSYEIYAIHLSDR